MRSALAFDYFALTQNISSCGYSVGELILCGIVLQCILIISNSNPKLWFNCIISNSVGTMRK